MSLLARGVPADPSSVDPEASEIGRKKWGFFLKLAMVVGIVITFFGLLWISSAPVTPPEGRRAAAEQGDAGMVPGQWRPIQRDQAPAEPARAAAAEAPGLPRNEGGSRFPPSGARQSISRVPISDFSAPLVAPAAMLSGSGQSTAAGTGTGSGTADPGTAAQANSFRAASTAGNGSSSSGDQLTDRLSAGDDQATAVGTMLPDRDLFLTAYSPLGCTVDSDLNTDMPGPFRCTVLNAPIKCQSGNVDCLPIGTRFGGTLQPLSRGQGRAFAVIRRIETRSGCIINLRAPMAGVDGQAGLDMEVNNHFFERFRGLAMIALLDSASQAAAVTAARALSSGGGGGNFYQFQGAGRQLGQGSFGDDVNIPPTGTRNGAKRALLMLMQDIDMRRCIRLSARG